MYCMQITVLAFIQKGYTCIIRFVKGFVMTCNISDSPPSDDSNTRSCSVITAVSWHSRPQFFQLPMLPEHYKQTQYCTQNQYSIFYLIIIFNFLQEI